MLERNWMEDDAFKGAQKGVFINFLAAIVFASTMGSSSEIEVLALENEATASGNIERLWTPTVDGAAVLFAADLSAASGGALLQWLNGALTVMFATPHSVGWCGSGDG